MIMVALGDKCGVLQKLRHFNEDLAEASAQVSEQGQRVQEVFKGALDVSVKMHEVADDTHATIINGY